MRVVIAGGHGKIALTLERLLSQRGNSVAGLIRNPAQAPDLEAAGAEAMVVDLENSSVAEVARALARRRRRGVRRGSGARQRRRPQGDGRSGRGDPARRCRGRGRRQAIPDGLVDGRRPACQRRGRPTRCSRPTYAPRRPPTRTCWPQGRFADATVVRPGHLTDDAGTGRVHLATSTGRGSMPRQDVAAVLVAVLDAPETAGHTFELISGDTPIADAVAVIAR